MNKIRIAIVEDDRDWLNAMIDYIGNESDLYIAGTAENKGDAVALARNIETDIILMDINLSGNKLDGIYAALEITEFSKSKIIMLTSLKEEEIIRSSFAAGAVNYVYKDNFRDIPNTIRSTYYGNSPIETLMKDYQRLKEEEQKKDLTEAEREVLGLMEKGLNRKQILSELYKSENTLRIQIRNILRKLGVKNSKEAVIKVKTRGICKPE